jgi:hypothetical protein
MSVAVETEHFIINGTSAHMSTIFAFRGRIMTERTWEGAYGRNSTQSPIPRHPSAAVAHDPNNDADEAAVKYWLQFSEFYQWPHVQTFDSWDQLISKCAQTVPLLSVAGCMLHVGTGDVLNGRTG